MDNSVKSVTFLAFIVTAIYTFSAEAKQICQPGREYFVGATGQCRRCAIPCSRGPEYCPPLCKKGWEEIPAKKRNQENKMNPTKKDYDLTLVNVIKADLNQTKDDRKATTSMAIDLSSTVFVVMWVFIGIVCVLLVILVSVGVALMRFCHSKYKRKEDAEAPKTELEKLIQIGNLRPDDVVQDQVPAGETEPSVPRDNHQPEGTDDGGDQQQQVPGENPGPRGTDNADDNVGERPTGEQEAVGRRFGVGGLGPLPSVAAAPSAENLVPDDGNDQRSVGGARPPSGENHSIEGVASDANHGRRSLDSGEPQAPTRGDNGTHGRGCAQAETTGHRPHQADVCAHGDKSEGLP